MTPDRACSEGRQPSRNSVSKSPQLIKQTQTQVMKKLHLKQAFAWLATCTLAIQAQGGGFTNNFTSGADFVANGVLGTVWDGVYLKGGDVTGSGGEGSTLIANETTFPGFLTVQSTSGGWAGGQNDGFLLYKMVSGDFDVAVQNV